MEELWWYSWAEAMWGGMEWGAEQQSWSKEQISEADIARVEKQQKQAKQIWGQIAQKKKNDTAIAQFIAFLMKEINDENLIKQVYYTFFLKQSSTSSSKQLPNIFYGLILAGLFVPFFHEELHKYWLAKTFDPFGANNITKLDSYIRYISIFTSPYSKKLPIKIDKHSFLVLVEMIVAYFWLLGGTEEQQAKQKKAIQNLSIDLGWNESA